MSASGALWAARVVAVGECITKQSKPIAELLDAAQQAIRELNVVLDQFESASFKLAREEQP